MVRIAHRPAELVGQLFRGSDAVSRGLLTQSQLRTSTWRQVFRDLYVDAAVPDSHALRCEAAGLILPSGAALTGRSAACVAGVPIEGHHPVSVVAPPPIRLQMRGLKVSRRALPAADVVPGAPRATVPLRSAWEIAREENIPEAVATLDLMLAHGYVEEAELLTRAGRNPHTRIAATVRLADARSGSPDESRLRVALVLAGFPRPVPRFAVRAGESPVTVDLGWPGLRVGANYYRDPAHIRGDILRRTALAEAGWTVFLAGPEVFEEPDGFANLCGYLTHTMQRRRDEER